MRYLRQVRLLEFLLIGVIFGVLEDFLAIDLTTGRPPTLRALFVVLVITIPFAFLSEIIVDHPRFWESIFRRRKK